MDLNPYELAAFGFCALILSGVAWAFLEAVKTVAGA